MTGMKEGAGEDPFANDEEEVSDPEPEGSKDQSDRSPSPSASERNDTESEQRRPRNSNQQIQIPYKFRRDGVQDGRKRVPLFLQDETKQAERDAQRELEDRFGDDVSLTDLREALVLAGLENLDKAEEELEAWGYGMTFDS
jgi:hypothetical protein